MKTQHDTFLDVLLEIRHANFEVFDKGFDCTADGVNPGFQITMLDGTQYYVHEPTEDYPTFTLEET